MEHPLGYSRLQIALHWLIAILILAAWATHEGMGRLLEARIESGILTPNPHAILGLAVFVLVLIRVIVRHRQGAPGPVPGSSAMAEAAALWGHRLLYLLMILTPIGGAITWFGGIEALGEGHELLGNALMIVALGHAVVAILHQLVLKDGTMTRMLRPRR
ncbi:cytochrome b [Nioella aestuarii]|uniref:cytochrome b n=1 Tax=Nioella aestuarii TaxID=1662864 RepID=UPI003D7FD3E5